MSYRYHLDIWIGYGIHCVPVKYLQSLRYVHNFQSDQYYCMLCWCIFEFKSRHSARKFVVRASCVWKYKIWQPILNYPLSIRKCKECKHKSLIHQHDNCLIWAQILRLSTSITNVFFIIDWIKEFKKCPRNILET